MTITSITAAAASAASAPMVQLTPANENIQLLAVIVCGVTFVLAVVLWLAWRYLQRNPPKLDEPETEIEDWL